MSISVAAIRTAYISLGTLVALTASRETDMVALGPRPVFPDIIVTDSDYNNVVTAQATWDASYAIYVAAFNAAAASQRAAELLLVALLPPNQWVKLTTLTNWGSATTQRIGVAVPLAQGSIAVSGTAAHTQLFYLTAISRTPTAHFPNS